MIDFEKTLHRLVNHKVEFVIIGGLAATVHGSSYMTHDLDICYARDQANLERLAKSVAPLHPRLRGAPAGLPFLWDATTLRYGLNFTLETDLGDLDLMGEVAGIGMYDSVRQASIIVELYGIECAVLSLEKLIEAKRAAGRPKDKLILPELEALRETLDEQSS